MNPAGGLFPAQMVFGRQRRHEHDLAAHRRGVLDGIGIEAAHHVVEHDAGIDLGAQFREVLGNQRRSHHAAVVVILGDHRREAGLRHLPHEFEMIERPRRDRRTGMNMGSIAPTSRRSIRVSTGGVGLRSVAISRSSSDVTSDEDEGWSAPSGARQSASATFEIGIATHLDACGGYAASTRGVA